MSKESPVRIPAVIDMQVLVTNGKSNGQATISIGILDYPSEEVIKTKLKIAEEELKESHGDDWRLMTRKESESYLIFQMTGTKGIVAGPKEWDE